MKEACEDVGFEVDSTDDGGLELINFDSKYIGVEELLDVLKPYVTADSSFAFLGEDGALWRWTPSGVEYATITWN